MKATPLAALLTVLLAPTVAAQTNLLANPSFENGGLNGWGFFGPNVYAEPSNPPAIVPHSGNTLCKIYGHFSGPFNVSGIYQSFAAAPGQTFTIDCWSRHWSGDPLTGFGPPADNWAVMKIAFFNAQGVEIGSAERNILDGNIPHNTWIDNAPVSGTAPASTVRVDALILFLQPNNAGGSGQFDDVEFFGPPSAPTYPGTGEDLILGTGIGGVAPTWGAGNDVKNIQAGNVLQVVVASPGGTFNLKPYVLVGQLFGTGNPPAPPAGFPHLWFGFSTFFALVNGIVPTPIGSPVIGPNGGSSTYYVLPTPLPSGISVMLQGLVIDPMVANSLYAASDATELRFQ